MLPPSLPPETDLAQAPAEPPRLTLPDPPLGGAPARLGDRAWITGLVRDAGAVALGHLHQVVILHHKPDRSIVTTADIAAERVLLDGIRRRYPDERIFSEEEGQLAGSGTARWYVDPIDGTSAFAEGLAHWGPSIARFGVVEGRLQVTLGATLLPRINELYVYDGKPWFNERLMSPISAPTSQRTVLLPSRFHDYFRLSWSAKGRCLGGTAAHLALVARGSAAAALVAPGWSLWDTAVGLALIDAVGGRILRVADGLPLDPLAHEGEAFVAAAPEIADEFVKCAVPA